MAISNNINKKVQRIFAFLLIFLAFMLIIIKILNFLDYRKILSTCPVPKQGGNINLYSQGYEDYTLSIIFTDITDGIYIDVGTNNPEIISVTKHFYLQGWQGIHIEPITKWYDMLVKIRPNAINLNIGLSNKEGELEFFHFTNSDALSTFNPKVALLSRNVKKPQTSYKVKVKTLSQILEEHPFDRVINFIKIDVEGLEKEILKGMDFKKFRPQLFVIEATEPSSFIPSHEAWEFILFDNGYNFVMFDGLNRYYIAKEYIKMLSTNLHNAMRCVKVVDRYYDIWHSNTELIFNNDL